MKRSYFLLLLLGIPRLALAVPALLEQGSTSQINGRTVMLTKLEALPFVEDEYSTRFRFDTFSNPKLKELRERYHLDTVVARGKDEFDRQIHLMEWTHRQFKKFGRPSTEAKGALEVLQGIEEGHRFFCAQYAQVFISAAASLGWVDRPLALRRHKGVNKVGGSTEHTTTEIWSNQYRKWIMLDPTSNLYVEMNGIPLNAWEIRKDWFHNGGENLIFVVGTERKRYRKSELPVMLGRFDGFGDLTFEPDEPDKYGFIGYVPNTDLMDSPYDYGRMFIVKDEFCEDTRWHTRDLPANPEVDPYFPIGQVALSLSVNNEKLIVLLKTLTPNFYRFEIRQDGGAWTPSGHRLEWELSAGTNRLDARTVNQFGVHGPISTVQSHVHE